MSLQSTTIQLVLSSGEYTAIGGQTASFPLSFNPSVSLSDGTAALQGNATAVFRPTIAAAGTFDIDLTAIPGGDDASPANPFGGFAFTSIVLLQVTAAGTLSIGPGPSNGWTGCLADDETLSGGTTAAVSIKVSTSTAGFPVSGSSKVLRITNTGTDPVSPTIVLIGRK